LVPVAVFDPVAPPGEMKSEASQVTWFEPAEEFASARSVIPVGGVIELLPPIEKNPTTSDPALALIDGARIDVVSVFWPIPPEAPTGVEVLTPL
jgi:hypothetical protein